MSLQDELLALSAIDGRVIKAVIEQDLESLKVALGDYLSLRKTIRTHLLDQSVASIEDRSAIDVLRNITTGDGLRTDRLFEGLDSTEDSGQLSEEFSEQELQALGSRLFYSWFSHIEYVTGLSELRPLVVRSSATESVVQLVRQVKDCYAFQQYEAAYALCRTLIEASIRDICVRRQLFPNLGENVVLFEKFNWGQLRAKVCSGSLETQLKSLYSELSTVIHGRKSVSRDEALHAFEATLQIVEALYDVHGL
jgi:hypothetical protein